MKPLEIKEYKNYNEELLLIRKKIIEKELNLDNINYYYKHDYKKNKYCYIYYKDENVIYVEEKILIKIINSFNLLENDDVFFSDNDLVDNYNHLYNRTKKYDSRKISDIKIFKKNDDIQIFKDINNKHYSENPERINFFLSKIPNNINFFDYNNIYEKEHYENIDKYQLPLYKIMKENKYALLDLLKNHPLNYNANDINHFLLHDRIPFINYPQLKEYLDVYYNYPKEDYFKKFEFEENDACLHLLDKQEIIILKKKEGYEIYSKKEHQENLNSDIIRYNFMKKFDKLVENGHEVDLENMTNKEIINLEIVDNQICLDDEEKFFHTGFYDNGIYTAHKNKINLKELPRIDSKILDINFYLEEEDFYTIIIKINKITIELNDFYIPTDKEFLLNSKIEQIWEKGCFLTSFGKAVYINEGKILERELKVPEWLFSDDKISFNKLIKKINTI